MNQTTLSGVTGMGSAVIQPQTQAIGALDEIGDQFDLFRCTALEYRVHPMDPTDTTLQAVAYVPDVDTQTVTSAQLSQSPIAACNSPFCGVPSPWIRVPRSQLKGMLDWYKCTPDAGAAEFESQGQLLLAGGLSDVLTYEVRGVMQFKNPVSASIMMERTIARLVKRGLVSRLPPLPSDNAQGSSTPVAADTKEDAHAARHPKFCFRCRPEG